MCGVASACCFVTYDAYEVRKPCEISEFGDTTIVSDVRKFSSNGTASQTDKRDFCTGYMLFFSLVCPRKSSH